MRACVRVSNTNNRAPQPNHTSDIVVVYSFFCVRVRVPFFFCIDRGSRNYACLFVTPWVSPIIIDCPHGVRATINMVSGHPSIMSDGEIHRVDCALTIQELVSD